MAARIEHIDEAFLPRPAVGRRCGTPFANSRWRPPTSCGWLCARSLRRTMKPSPKACSTTPPPASSAFSPMRNAPRFPRILKRCWSVACRMLRTLGLRILYYRTLRSVAGTPPALAQA